MAVLSYTNRLLQSASLGAPSRLRHIWSEQFLRLEVKFAVEFSKLRATKHTERVFILYGYLEL
jgi:hypothetical protein